MKLIKRILYILLLLTLYELSKYVTEQLIITLEANDDIDAPCDYVLSEHEKSDRYEVGG